MKRWILVLAALVLAAGGFGSALGADELTVSVPGETKFLLHLDLQAFRATAVGGKLFDLAKRRAEQELSAGPAHGNTGGLEKIHEMLGFDPFAEIQTILVSAANYDRPEQSLVVSIGVGKSTGNLEGLILALPGYGAEQYGKYTIHSAAPEKGVQVFGAIHTDAKANKTVFLAAQRESITHLLDQVDGKTVGGASFKTIKLASDEKPILAIEVLALPTEMIGDGPQAGVVKVLRTVSLRIRESEGEVTVGIWLAADTEQQAEQLRQMAQGLIAMLDFAQSTNPDDEDLKKMQRFVHEIKAARDGSSLKVSLTVPAADLNKLLDEQLGDQ
ncbi:MAG TPA: hypothetical protein VG125_00565 [Pirellulales bacterium]|jgi:hypothetical protein|nr:hypothetical protein [Pirellulales bacterium]